MKRRFSSALLLLLFFLSLPLSVHAAETTPFSGTSSGTMIAAALETVGYHMQAKILKDLSNSLEWLGALIYLGVIVSAVLTVALSGSYRNSLWLLVGPPVFVFASGLTIGGAEHKTSASGVEWRFGEFNDFEKRKDKVLVNQNLAKNANVSWLFHNYNILVSEIVQELIKVTTQKDIAKQLIFMARQRTLDDLFGTTLDDSKARALAAYFMVVCDTEVADARLLAVAHRDPAFLAEPEYAAAKKRYCARYPLKDKPFTPGPWMDVVYDLKLDASPSVSREEYQQKWKSAEHRVSCSQLWGWTKEAARRQALGAFEKVQVNNFDPYAWKIYGSALFGRVISAVHTKVTEDRHVEARRKGPGDPCPDAEDTADSQAELGGDAAAFGQLSKIISALIIRKELTSGPSHDIVQRIHANHSGHTSLETAAQGGIAPSTKEAILRRQKAQEFATARKYEAFTLIHLLPYLQGVLLFGLAVSYPFFAMLLLVPGQAGSFFTWMALWAWVKVWDVGWSLIMVADEIIWELLPKSAYFNPNNPAPYSSPVSLLEGAFDGDPAYSIATYWLLLSMMVTAVPLVSAQAVMGSKKAIAGVLLNGLGDIANALGGSAGDRVAAEQLGAYTQKEAQARGESIMARANRHFPQIQQHLAAAQKLSENGPAARSVAEISRGLPEFGSFVSGAGAQAYYQAASAVSGIAGASEAESQYYERMAEISGNKMAAPFEPGGHTSNLIQDTKRYDDFQSNQWGGMLAKIDPTGQLGKLKYGTGSGPNGTPTVAEISARQQDAGQAMVLDAAGIDPNSEIYVSPNADLNSRFNDAYKQLLYQHAVAFSYEGAAEAQMGIAAVGSGLLAGVAGPAGTVKGLKLGLDATAEAKRSGFSSQQDSWDFTRRFRQSMISLSTNQAMWDPRYIENSLASGYTSVRRGGEWWQLDLFPGEVETAIDGLTFDMEATFSFQQARFQAERTRWFADMLILGVNGDE